MGYDMFMKIIEGYLSVFFIDSLDSFTESI